MPTADGTPEALALVTVRIDGGIEATEATATGSAGHVPLFLSHSFGRGQARLLNLAMSSYPSLAMRASAEAAARLWQQMLAPAQVSPVIELRTAQGQRLRNIEVTRWTNGPVQIVSVFRHGGDAETAALHLPEALHAYDLKAGQGLGQRQTMEVTVTPYRARFYAFSPEPIEPVAMAAAQTISPGSVLRVALTAALPTGRQAARIQVELPDGRMADWVTRVAVADPKGITIELPVAFNDPRGTWTIRATELYTGQTAVARFEVD